MSWLSKVRSDAAKANNYVQNVCQKATFYITIIHEAFLNQCTVTNDINRDTTIDKTMTTYCL